ncbi:DoxX family protein [Mycolicibacterium sp.]|uniref:DoxX family protein n=1 Tax=Mycolicibacterium sp. TaxID=2320850 RepID=UPI003D0B26C7
MNVALWITSGLLAAAYLAIGGMKLALSKDKLAQNPNMAAMAGYPQAFIKSLGAVEVAGALGLILPWATGIAPVLTPAAAIGLVLVQVGAAIFHGRRREYKQLPVNAVFLALAAFVAIGRIAELAQ